MASAASIAPTSPLVSIRPSALSDIDPPSLGARSVKAGATIRAPEPKVNQDRSLRAPPRTGYTRPMPPETVIVVSDAHLGHAPPSVAAAFGRFLAAVPSLGQHLVINGDLFDFWFEYRRVISREAFPTLVALAELRKEGVALTVTGGNHDRWGGGFWSAELGAPFHANPVEIRLAGLRTFLAHGDGLVEPRRASRV